MGSSISRKSSSVERNHGEVSTFDIFQQFGHEAGAALNALERDGHVIRVRGCGAFVVLA